jgi:uncharacterized protein YjeT (DUF2065 family)|tara:strand:+ start:313 stop:498 length:186 start_codon:yes stop_codon:yes gene_type:complete
MKDLFTALGLLLFIEGLFFAIFPTRIKKMLKKIDVIPITKLRSMGIFFLLLGFLIVWYIKK